MRDGFSDRKSRLCASTYVKSKDSQNKTFRLLKKERISRNKSQEEAKQWSSQPGVAKNSGK
jgi:hypothetical protein